MGNVLDTEEVRQQLIVAQRSPFIYYDYYTRVLSSQAKTIYLKLSGAPTSIKSQRKQNHSSVTTIEILNCCPKSRKPLKKQ